MNTMRKVIEGMLALPATALYGVPSLIALPMIMIATPFAAIGEPDLAIVYGMLILLTGSAVVGLVALWVSIFGGGRRRPTLMATGIGAGIAGAAGFVWTTFSTDRFDIGVTWQNNSMLLLPLLLVLVAGISRLAAILTESRDAT